MADKQTFEAVLIRHHRREAIGIRVRIGVAQVTGEQGGITAGSHIVVTNAHHKPERTVHVPDHFLSDSERALLGTWKN